MVIGCVVHYYYLFQLSLHDIEALLLDRDIFVIYESCWRSLILLAVALRALMLSVNFASAADQWPQTSVSRGDG
jgi:transposase-like protein